MARLSDAKVKALTDDIPTRNVIHMLQQDLDKVTAERDQMTVGYEELRGQLLALKAQLRTLGAIS